MAASIAELAGRFDPHRSRPDRRRNMAAGLAFLGVQLAVLTWSGFFWRLTRDFASMPFLAWCTVATLSIFVFASRSS
jgi:hypothetical protein